MNSSKLKTIDKIKLLDCTLRDGGQGLEDMSNNGIEAKLFNETDRLHIAASLRDSKVEIIELGSMSESKDNREGFAIYQDVQSLSKFIPERSGRGEMYVGLYTGPDTEVSKIPDHSPELVDGIRVIIRYSELDKSLLYCKALVNKGYKVFVQPMLTMRYSYEELHRLIDSVNEMGAYALYFVDSYGYMENKDVDELLGMYSEELDPEIYIGFHAHNNMERALENVKHFINQKNGRKKIVDSCAAGMGQGAGNLPTEVLVQYMNESFKTNYNFNSILEVCDILDKFSPHCMESWGYSPVRLVPAAHKAAYKYAAVMKLRYGMTLVEINKVLCSMPTEMKHRYTLENLEKLLSGELYDGCGRIYC